jgi:hypothetical protein
MSRLATIVSHFMAEPQLRPPVTMSEERAKEARISHCLGLGMQVRETEAEATAFVVCHAIGLETGSAACDYILLRNGDAQLLNENRGLVRGLANAHRAHGLSVSDALIPRTRLCCRSWTAGPPHG